MSPIIQVKEEGTIEMNIHVPGIFYNLTLIRPQTTKENVEQEIPAIKEKLERYDSSTAVVVTKDYEAGNVKVPIRRYGPEVPNSQKKCRTVHFIPLKKWLQYQQQERFEEWLNKQLYEPEKYISEEHL